MNLDWHKLDLPDEVELGELLYKRNPIPDSDDEGDNTGQGNLSWQRAQESGHGGAYYAAAAAMLIVLRLGQARYLDVDVVRNGGANADPEPLLPDGYEWMICELMGHVCHVGRVLEVEKFGSKMARVDVPKRADDGGIRWETHWFTASAVYRLTPTDEATVMRRVPSAPPQIGRYHHLPDDTPKEREDDDYNGDPRDAW